MGSQELSSGVRIKANGGTIFIGGSNVAGSNGYPIANGEEAFIDVDSMSKVYVRASSTGFTAEFLAS